MERLPTDSGDEVLFRSASEAAGYTQASNLILLDTKLSDGAKVTYLLLRMYAWQGANAYPGQARMASERGSSDRTIRNHLTELVERGLITIEQRGKKLTNRYWIESLDSVYKPIDLPAKRRAFKAAKRAGTTSSTVADTTSSRVGNTTDHTTIQTTASPTTNTTDHATDNAASDWKNSSTHVTGKKLPFTDRKIISAPSLEENTVIDKYSEQALNVNPSRRRMVRVPKTAETVPATDETLNDSESNIYLRLIIQPIQVVETLTGDGNSRARYIQLREICLEKKQLSAWDTALRSTERRMKRSDLDPLEKPAAWFDSALVRELDKRGVIVPSGTPEEKEEVRGLIGTSLFGKPDE